MGPLTPYRYFFDYRNKGRGNDTDIHGAEARDVMKTGHRTAMNNKELSDPKMPTVLRLRNGCRLSGSPRHWPPVVICVLPDRDGLRTEPNPPRLYFKGMTPKSLRKIFLGQGQSIPEGQIKNFIIVSFLTNDQRKMRSEAY